MNELLDALGVRRPALRAVLSLGIWAFFGVAMLAVAVAQAALERAAGLNAMGSVVVVAVVWLAWTYWHSVLMLRHRTRYVATLSLPYRRAFIVDLVPGLTISFSQMLRPALNGANLRSGRVIPLAPQSPADWLRDAVGAALVLVALGLFQSAWRTLGTARVGFVPEFVEPETFVPLRTGPYARVRHPLFWSGIAFSVALALLCATPVAIAVAVVNTGYGLIYNALEDRRLKLIFGDRYGRYASAVPRIVPVRVRAVKGRPGRA